MCTWKCLMRKWVGLKSKINGWHVQINASHAHNEYVSRANEWVTCAVWMCHVCIHFAYVCSSTWKRKYVTECMRLCMCVCLCVCECVSVRSCDCVTEIKWSLLRAHLQGAHDNHCQFMCACVRASVVQHTCFLSVGTPEYMQNSEITCFSTHTHTQKKTFRHTLVFQKKTTHISNMSHTYKWMVPRSQLNHERFSHTLPQSHTYKYNSHTHHHLFSSVSTYMLLAHFPSL